MLVIIIYLRKVPVIYLSESFHSSSTAAATDLTRTGCDDRGAAVGICVRGEGVRACGVGPCDLGDGVLALGVGACERDFGACEAGMPGLSLSKAGGSSSEVSPSSESHWVLVQSTLDLRNSKF